MYTIKEASLRTGVPVATLRAWERRYAIVTPRRTDSGYRLYDDHAIAALTAMRHLVEDGWSPATAASAITKEGPESVLGRAARTVAADTSAGPPADRAVNRPTHHRTGPAGQQDDPGEAAGARTGPTALPEGPALTEAFIEAASSVDVVSVESILDRGFALGTYEQVVDGWLMPTLRALGDAWVAGDVDVAGEHAASYAVMRRLGQLFAAAASLGNGPRVLVGLPGGCHHELGALAFAVAARRRATMVVYVGADLPAESWKRAVQAFPTEVAVLGVPTIDDTAKAEQTVRALREARPRLVIAAGGTGADHLADDVVRLPHPIADAARAVEQLAH